ncbi:MAG: phosphoribosyltransferase [bacterium]|nr:phosphoribosyltransferase [bacterium]
MSRIETSGKNPLDILKACGGWYKSPSEDDISKGMLVGYAGEYEPEKQWVGFMYANFAKAERYPYIMTHYAISLEQKIRELLSGIDTFCGAPMGGITFAFTLASVYQKNFSYFEKKITKLKTTESQEQSTLVMNRHKIEYGERVVIVEDVVNNFSTANKMAELIYAVGAQVVALICLLNRSPEWSFRESLVLPGAVVPVFSLIRQSMFEFRQDDPTVRPFIDSGRVVWKPKDKESWQQLMRVMHKV